MTKDEIEHLIEKMKFRQQGGTDQLTKHYNLGIEVCINDLKEYLTSLQEPTEEKWRCSKCGAEYFENKKECEYICGDCISRVSIYH